MASMCLIHPLSHLTHVGGEVPSPVFLQEFTSTRPPFRKPCCNPKVDSSVSVFPIAPWILVSKVELCPTCSGGSGANPQMAGGERAGRTCLLEPVKEESPLLSQRWKPGPRAIDGFLRGILEPAGSLSLLLDSQRDL